MHRTGTTQERQVAGFLKGIVGREGLPEQVTQVDTFLVPALTICPAALCHLGPVLAPAEPKASSINGHMAREASHLPSWCQHPAVTWKQNCEEQAWVSRGKAPRLSLNSALWSIVVIC